MEISEELLEKFFAGKCTPEEDQLIRVWLAEHTEILDMYFNEGTWSSFSTKEKLPAGVSKRIYQGIIKKAPFPPVSRHRIIRYAAIAASVLMVMATAWWTLKQNPVATLPKTASVTSPERPAEYKIQKNHTAKTISISLADGSAVELAPSAEIRFLSSYPNSGRNIYLKGRALFTVAKDPANSFTVYAGGLGTTALGTVFRITEKEKGPVKVELLRGRVVVRPDSFLRSRGIRDAYLVPGQQLSLNQSQDMVTIKMSRPGDRSLTKTQPHKADARQPFRFDNQPLTEIIKTIEDTYHVHFVYEEGTLDNLSFTGAFNENNETLDNFLNTICLLNDLTMEKQYDGIHLVPKKR